ncbi:MAG: TolC family protein [Desulfosalsimonas sp.]
MPGPGTVRICLTLSAALAAALLFSGTAVPVQGSELTLKQAYRTAIEENENVGVSRQELRKAKSDVTEATSALYPQLSARGEYTREKERDFSLGSGTGTGAGFDQPNEYGTMTLNLDQHIYQWGKVWSGRKMAKYYSEGSGYRHVRRVQEILYQVSVSYYESLLGRRSIEIAENALNRAVWQAEQARARFEAGVVTQTDVLRAEVQVARSSEDLERAKNDYDNALEQLALEMGVESTPDSIEEPPERSFEAGPVNELYETALAKRQDYRQAEKQQQGAEKRVDFEQADFFPNISLTGQYTVTDKEELFYGGSDDWKASIVVSYPLFTGWQRSAEVAGAKAEKSQADYSLARLRKQIRNEVRSVYLDIQTQQKVIDQLEKQVRSAERNYQETTAMFEQGIVTAVDQVDAFTALNEAENRLAQSYYTYQLDLLRLKMATGTFQKDLLEKEILNENG